MWGPARGSRRWPEREGAGPDASGLLIPAGGRDGCWHAVGNAGITATAHVGGWTTLYATSRGVVRLTGPASRWGLVAAPAPERPVIPVAASERTAAFGLGCASWRARFGPATVERRIAASADGEPVLRIDVSITGAPDGWAYEEHWVAEPRALLVGALMSTFEPAPPGYGPRDRAVWAGMYGLSAVVRAATTATRLAIAPTLVRAPRVDAARDAVVFPAYRRIAEVPATSPAWFDRALPDLFVAVIDRPGAASGPAVGAAGAGAVAIGSDGRITVPIPGPGTGTVTFAVGLARDDAELDRLIEHAREAAPFASRTWGAFARLELPGAGPPIGGPAPTGPSTARRATDTAADSGSGSEADSDRAVGPALHPGPDPSLHPELDADVDPTDRGVTDADLVREATWHAAALVAAEQHDDHFGRRYIAQGSAYGFIHGLQGAPRDYALFAVPMALLDPEAAREQLEVMMAMARPSGATAYAHTGRGRTTSGGLHAAPTDLPLFFLWSLTEYVWATGDHAFLDEPVCGATPLDRAVVALRYVEERVGRGEHGLLRVGSGDWSDPISAMVADRGAFHERGESGFNTAFAVYALPRAAALVRARHPDAAARADDLATELCRAMEDTWTGSWFLRGWDGRGHPIGADHLFLDGQVWALIAGIGSPEQRAALVETIAERCGDPSPIGATILDRPHDVRFGMLAPGWDCNGGVWAAINGLLAWGYAAHDAPRAWASLRAQSLAAHARSYPDIWYGIWSGPDAYNAHFGSRPGETFVQPATPMREFPVMNANAHAGPLLGLVRTLGIETGPDGITVAPRPGGPTDWTLTTGLGRFTPSGFTRRDPVPVSDR